MKKVKGKKKGFLKRDLYFESVSPCIKGSLLKFMQKTKILIGAPLAVIFLFLIYSFSIIVYTDTIANWRHYVAVFLFLPLLFFYFKNISNAIVGTGIYLLLATFNLLAFTPAIKTMWMTFKFSTPVSTPPIQLLSLGIFVLYFILNLDSLIAIYLDYKETKAT